MFTTVENKNKTKKVKEKTNESKIHNISKKLSKVTFGNEILNHTYDLLPKNCKKYWKKRYDLFKNFDQGIYLTSELWYSVTPESCARAVACMVKQMLPNAKKILDICCGGGGNLIQFAQLFDITVGLDINESNIFCAKHNAKIYGIQDKIFFKSANWNIISEPTENGVVNQNWIPDNLKNLKKPYKVFDFVFLSPPWGGPEYTKYLNSFNLLTMEDFPLHTFIKQIMQYTRNLGIFLPKSLNLFQLREIVRTYFGEDAKCRVVFLNYKKNRIGMIVFFGKKVADTKFTYDGAISYPPNDQTTGVF